MKRRALVQSKNNSRRSSSPEQVRQPMGKVPQPVGVKLLSSQASPDRRSIELVLSTAESKPTS